MNALSGVATLETAASSRVVQLSDTHLMREPGGQLVGIDTDRSVSYTHLTLPTMIRV